MKDKARIKRILKLIEKIWSKSPDLRFGQLLINLRVCGDDIRLWNNIDDGLEKWLKERLKGETFI